MEEETVQDTTPLQGKVLEEKPVKTSSAVWLGAANAATGLLCAFAEGSAFQYLFVNKLGLDQGLNNIIWILFGVWNALNDPIYGFLADRTHSKLGRRRPWIRYGAPIMAVIYALMWLSFPDRHEQWFLFIQEFLGLFLYDIVYTAIASAIYVMPYEMAVTNKARNKIFIVNILFSVINYGAPMVLNSQLDAMIKGNYEMFCVAMAVAGIVCGAIVFFSTFFYKENGYIQEEEQPKFWEGLKMCLKNKSFLLFEVVSWTVIYAQSALMVGLAYLTGMWANDSITTNGWLGGTSIYVLYGAIALGLILFIILFVKMTPKWGTRTSILIAVGTMGAGCLLGSFLGRFFWVTVLFFFCAGAGLAGGIYLIPLINGDVMDKDEMDNGKRREGVYAGINSLITKPAQSIAVSLFPVLIGAFGFHFDLNLADGTTDFMGQPDSAKDWFFFCWLFITGILLVLSFVAMWFYPLHGKKWDKAKEDLSVAHAKKEAAYEQAMLLKLAKEGQGKEDKPSGEAK
jgi:GPH family glycoside/pentoside/hexuronide:cation symporter